MMDLADQAQVHEQGERESALQAQLHRIRSQMPATSPICVDCGQPIDSRRREANPTARRCIECQSSEELLSNRRAA